jgi:hypothetical protein
LKPFLENTKGVALFFLRQKFIKKSKMASKTPTSNNTAGLPSIVVVSDVDGRKFKMVLKGALEKLSVTKIKHYLEQSTKIPANQQMLSFHGSVLEDNLVGADFGLHPDAVLHLRGIQPSQQQDTSFGSGGQNTPPPPQQNYHQQQQQPSYPSRSAPSFPPPINNNGVSLAVSQQQQARIAEELAAIRSSLDAEKGYTHAYKNNTPPAPTTTSFTNQENQRPAANNIIDQKNTVHSSLSEPINHLAVLESIRNQNRNVAGMITSPQQQQQQHQQPYPVPPSSALSEMQISASMVGQENAQLRGEIDKLKGKIAALEAALAETSKRDSAAGGFPPGGVLAAARVQLSGLSQELGIDLSFDENFTCVIGSDESTVLITVDPATERLYLYSTLLDSIADKSQESKVYRALLEWSMLGRDMAGGGVGIDPSTGVVIMSTSIDLKNSRPPALRDTAPVFVESLVRWRQTLSTLLNA